MERFSGSIQLMNKEGHIGVVKNTNQPIVKKVERVHLSPNLLEKNTRHSNGA